MRSEKSGRSTSLLNISSVGQVHVSHMSLFKTEEALQHALGMIDAYKQEADLFAEKIAQMKTCEHVWNRDVEILAELDGRDLSYYEAECHKCGILKSETF